MRCGSRVADVWRLKETVSTPRIKSFGYVNHPACNDALILFINFYPTGGPPLHYAQTRAAVFNVFELYCCVKWHGGYEHLSKEHAWHRVAYDLCRVSKRRRDVAQAAEECYRQYLRPHDAALANLPLKLSPTLRDRRSDARDDVVAFDARQEATTKGDGVMGVDVWTERRRKLRVRSQPTQRRLKRRFKKSTSFDLLSTIPLPLDDRCDVVTRISPSQRRLAPPLLSENNTSAAVQTHAGWMRDAVHEEPNVRCRRCLVPGSDVAKDVCAVSSGEQ